MTVVTPISEDDSPTEQHRLLHAAEDGSSMQATTSPTAAACSASSSHRPLWRRDDKSPRSSSLNSPTSRSLRFSRSAPNTPFQPAVHKLTVFSSPPSTAPSPAITSSRLRISAPSTPSSRASSSPSWSAVLLLWCSRLFFVAPWLLLLCLLLSRFDVGLPWLHSQLQSSPSLRPPAGPVPALPSSRRLYRSLAQYRLVHSAPPAPHLAPTEDHTRTALSPLPAVGTAPAAAPASPSPSRLSPPPPPAPITNVLSQGQFLEQIEKRKIAVAIAESREEQLRPRSLQREREAAALVERMKSRLLDEVDSSRSSDGHHRSSRGCEGLTRGRCHARAAAAAADCGRSEGPQRRAAAGLTALSQAGQRQAGHQRRLVRLFYCSSRGAEERGRDRQLLGTTRSCWLLPQHLFLSPSFSSSHPPSTTSTAQLH